MDDYLRELDESFGMVSADLIERYERQWPS